MTKICKYCGSKELIKKGKYNNKQRYYCKNCNKKFINSSRITRKEEKLFKNIWIDYVFNRYLVRDLKKKYLLNKEKIYFLLQEYKLRKKRHNPRKIHLQVDAICFGKKKSVNRFCIIVFRDFKPYDKSENVYFSFEFGERTEGYLKGRICLEKLGYEILSVTGDGFNGIKQAFAGITYQMCQIHMKRIIKRQTTQNPQTEAGIFLLNWANDLHKMNSSEFKKRLDFFEKEFDSFLKEKTKNQNTGKWFYTHKRVRSALKSIKRFSNDLFVFEKNISIHKNTNSLEGHFSHVRDYINIHRSLSRKQKVKILYTIFHASTVAPDQKKLDKII